MCICDHPWQKSNKKSPTTYTNAVGLWSLSLTVERGVFKNHHFALHSINLFWHIVTMRISIAEIGGCCQRPFLVGV